MKSNAIIFEEFNVSKLNSENSIEGFGYLSIICDQYLDIEASNYLLKKSDNIFDTSKADITLMIKDDIKEKLSNLGDKDDIKLALSLLCDSWMETLPNQKIGFHQNYEIARKKIKLILNTLPSNLKELVTSDKTYKKILALPTFIHLSTINNIKHDISFIKKMEHVITPANERYISQILNELEKLTAVDNSLVNTAYNAIIKLVEEYLIGLRDRNVILLQNANKKLSDIIIPNHGNRYFKELKDLIQKNINDKYSTLRNKLTSIEEKLSDDNEINPDENITTPEELNNNSSEELNQDNQNISNEQPIGQESVYYVISENNIFAKKLKRFDPSIPAYVKIHAANATNPDELMMIISYGYSKLEMVNWYIELIDTNNPNYVVPMRRQELINFKNQLQYILDEATKNPKFERRTNINTRYYEI